MVLGWTYFCNSAAFSDKRNLHITNHGFKWPWERCNQTRKFWSHVCFLLPALQYEHVPTFWENEIKVKANGDDTLHFIITGIVLGLLQTMSLGKLPWKVSWMDARIGDFSSSENLPTSDSISPLWYRQKTKCVSVPCTQNRRIHRFKVIRACFQLLIVTEINSHVFLYLATLVEELHTL